MSNNNKCLPCRDICDCITFNSPDESIIIERTNCTWTIEVNPEALIVENPVTEPSFVEAGTGITVTGTGTEEDPYIIVNTGVLSVNSMTGNVTIPTYNGSETKVTAGTNISVTGTGTIANPYIVNCTLDLPDAPDGSETIVEAGDGISVAGDGTTDTPYIITNEGVISINGETGEVEIPIADGTETIVTGGINITVTGDGSTLDPYVIDCDLELPETPDGSETDVNAGTGVSVTGNGTTLTPYVVANTGVISVNGNSGVVVIPAADGSETKVTAGVNVTVTGVGTIGNPYVISSNDATCAETILPFEGADCCKPLDEAIIFSGGLTSATDGEACEIGVTLTPWVEADITYDTGFSTFVDVSGALRASAQCLVKEGNIIKFRGYMHFDGDMDHTTFTDCFTIPDSIGSEVAYLNANEVREWLVFGFKDADNSFVQFIIRTPGDGSFQIRALTDITEDEYIINLESIIFEIDVA